MTRFEQHPDTGGRTGSMALEVRATFCAVALLLGCGPQSHATSTPPPTRPPPPTDPAEPEPAPEPQPTPEPEPPAPRELRVVRTEGRTEILLVDPLEELLALPGGVAWTQSGEVWVLLDDAEVPAVVGKTIDPHGLTTDGRTLYWVGFEENGLWNRETGETRGWPRFAGVNEQTALAFGDALYCQDRMSLWRFGERHIRRINFEMGTWNIHGFRAGKDRMFLAVTAIDRDAPKESRISYEYVRVRTSGKHTAVPSLGQPIWRRWDVNPAGDLAFISDSSGTVSLMRANRETPTVAFTQPGAEALCFCGADLCTVAEGSLDRHRRGAVQHIANPGDLDLLACSGDRVAWAGPGDGRSQITVVSLPHTR